MTKLRVSVVIPTYNGKTLLERHLPSVIAQLRPGDELIIVDDASSDDTVLWLQKKMTADKEEPQDWHSSNRTAKATECQVIYGKLEGHSCCLIKLLRNRRFAVAVNTGVVVASNPLIFLVNNDVSVRSGTLDRLVSHFELDGTGSLFAVGCSEVEGSTGVVGGKNKLWFARGLFQHSRADEYSSGPTAWASGGSALFATNKWRELEGFDPRFYPAYWEDVDLSFRARKLGWRVEFDAEAVVDHLHESTNVTVFGSTELKKRSFRHQRLFTRIHATFWQRLQYYLWLPYWRVTCKEFWV